MVEQYATFAGLCPECWLEVSSPGGEAQRGKKLAFSNGKVVALPSEGRYPVVLHGDPHWVVTVGQDGIARLATEDGQVTELGGAVSPMAGYTNDGVPAWQDSPTTFRVQVETRSRPLPIPWNSTQGFMGDPFQKESWGEWNTAHPFIAQGLEIKNPCFIDGWVGGNHPSRPILLAYELATLTLFEAGPTSNSPINPRLLKMNGQPVFVCGYPGAIRTRDQFVPYVEPPVTIRIPTFAPFGRPVACGLFFDPRGGPTIAPVTARYPAVLPRPMAFVDYSKPEADVDASLRLAIADGVPLDVYPDHHGIDLVQVPPGERALIYAYPTIGKSVDYTLLKVKNDVEKCVMAGVPFDLAVAVYRQWNGKDYPLDEQLVLDVLEQVVPLAVVHGCGVIWGFAYERGNDQQIDGIARFPSFAEAWRRLVAASPNPNAFPVRHDAPHIPDSTEDEPMKSNPTDAIAYPDVLNGLAPRAAQGHGYTIGQLDGYRLLAEGTPLADVLADRSAPTQTPIPNVPYAQWAAAADGLVVIRHSVGAGLGYNDGLTDAFRRFGGEHWAIEDIIASILGKPTRSMPFTPLF